MKLKVRELFERALEEGLAYGLMRSYKHDDAPRRLEDWTPERQGALVAHLLGALDEIIADWEDQPGE